MARDNRDPSLIGAALETERARSPQTPIGEIADNLLKHPIRNYEESNSAYADRISESQGYNKNGQLAIFHR